MINLAPTAYDALADSLTDSVTEITSAISSISKNVPIIGNAALCADSISTTCRADINFYGSPSPVAKVFFGASCLCGLIGAASSGTALVTPLVGIPVTGIQRGHSVPEGLIVPVNTRCIWEMLQMVILQMLLLLVT